MFGAFGRAFRTPDLRKKILFTIMMMVLFRVGSFIPAPGVDYGAVQSYSMGDNDLLALVNLFSGGALLQLSIFALGIMPYITASIIIQLLRVVIPRFETLHQDGQSGQAKLTQYTRYLTIALGVLQATTIVTLARTGQLLPGVDPIKDDSWWTAALMILVLTAGTGVIMWMGELITDRGVGNGMSVLIFTQITARFPVSLWSVKQSREGVQGWLAFAAVIAVGLLIMLAVIYVEQAQRRIPVQYAKRMVGRRLFGGSTTYIPLKVNQSGVIPVIFASSMLYLPVLYAQFQPDSPVASWIAANLSKGDSIWYNGIFFVLIVFFAYFYVAITFDPKEISDNMKKYGGFIPGIRAGSATERYLAYVLSRLTAPGSLYLAIIALIPTLAFVMLGSQQEFLFGGTSILIIVGVGLDTVKQIESQLQQRNYEGFLK